MLTPPPQTEEGRHKAQLWLRLMRGGRARCAPSSGGGRQQPSELISSLLFFALLRPMTVKGQMATMAPGCAANRPSSCRLALIRMRSDCGWMAVWWRFDGGSPVGCHVLIDALDDSFISRFFFVVAVVMATHSADPLFVLSIIETRQWPTWWWFPLNPPPLVASAHSIFHRVIDFHSNRTGN